MLICLNCDDKFKGRRPGEVRKFCSRSCSAQYNNKLSPKRLPEGSCDNCGEANTKSRKYCQKCRTELRIQQANELWNTTTLAEMKRNKETNARNRYPYISGLARAKYIKAGLSLSCRVCGYDLHVDIAHIKAVSSFPETATVGEVNNLSNLVALCKNHHWEYDRQILNLPL